MTRSPLRDGAPRARRAYRVGPRCRAPDRPVVAINTRGPDTRAPRAHFAPRLRRATGCEVPGQAAAPAGPEQSRVARAAGSACGDGLLAGRGHREPRLADALARGVARRLVAAEPVHRPAADRELQLAVGPLDRAHGGPVHPVELH